MFSIYAAYLSFKNPPFLTIYVHMSTFLTMFSQVCLPRRFQIMVFHFKVCLIEDISPSLPSKMFSNYAAYLSFKNPPFLTISVHIYVFKKIVWINSRQSDLFMNLNVIFKCLLGLWQALREVYPTSSLHGCGFHWAQAVQRRVQNVGLQTTYQRREGVHHHIRKLLAIPFLPARDIQRAFQKLKEKVDDNSEPLRELFRYVQDQWMDSTIWSPEEWSVYRQTVRTNNDTEGI